MYSKTVQVRYTSRVLLTRKVKIKASVLFRTPMTAKEPPMYCATQEAGKRGQQRGTEAERKERGARKERGTQRVR
jgi:hypothetical protein